MTKQMERAKQELENSLATCVVSKEEKLFTSTQHGIRPLLNWLQKDKTFFDGACVADRIIGKAAALLLVLGGIKSLWAGVLSERAAKVLEQHGIPYACGCRVAHIVNRAGDGMCPMEQCVWDVEDPKEAYFLLLKKAEELQGGKN